VVLRYYLVEGFSRQNVLIAIGSVAGIGVLFLAAQFYGTMAVPQEEFIRYLQGRMADPSRTELLNFSYIWYQPLVKEIHDTWERMPRICWAFRCSRLLIWLHAPLWRYFCGIDPIVVEPFTPRRHRRHCRP